MANTNLGRVSLVPKGEYDPAASYERLDLVQHEGEGYVVLRSVTGVAPVDGEDYMLLAKKGNDSDMLAADYDPTGKKTDVYLYTDEAIQELKDKPVLTGGIPFATTYTPEGGVDGVDFAVDVPGVDAYKKGITICVKFHKRPESKPRLSINGMPSMQLACRTLDGSYRPIGDEGTKISILAAFTITYLGVPSYLIVNELYPADRVAFAIAPHLAKYQPVYTTYTPEGGVDGIDYAIDIPGLAGLYEGMVVTISPHVDNGEGEPKLSVNGGTAIHLFTTNISGIPFRPIRPSSILVGGTFALRLFLDFEGWSCVDIKEVMVSDVDGIEAYAKNAVQENVMLVAGNWSGDAAPYTQNVAIALIGYLPNGYIAPAEGLTAEQREAARNACIGVLAVTSFGGIANITVVADGAKPTVDIPTVVTILG